MLGPVHIIAMVMLMSGSPAPRAGFSFVHITDTHVPGAGSVAALKALAEDVNRRPSKPAFIVNSGDVTELGTEAEFAAYRDAVRDLEAPIFAVPGNHDVRWSPLGKQAFSRSCGPLYRSFDHGGCHFILLDSSVVLEHWGHFDGAQLTWLRADLRKVRKDTPTFLFLHHWFGRDKDNIDNADELLRILAPYNVVAVFVGHGHSDTQWTINGIRCFMAKGLYQGSRHEVEVKDGSAQVTLISGASAGKRDIVASLPLDNARRLRPSVRWQDSGNPMLARRRFSVSAGQTLPNPITAQWRVEDTPIGGTISVGGAGKPGQEAAFSTENLASGWYTLSVRFEYPAAQAYIVREPFTIARPDNGVRALWERATASTIQGSPILHDGVVYVGSFDGALYAWDALMGKLRWKRATRDSVFATPYVYAETIIIPSTDGCVYALNRRTGRMRWIYDARTPLFATAAVAAGVAIVGGNKSILGIDVERGTLRWTVPTGSFFQSRAAASGGLAVLGGWDNALYCVDAESGRVVWKKEMGRTNGGRGRLSFYYSPAIASPTISEGRVYVCTNDGVLHCVDLATGEDVWEARAPAGGDTFGYSSPLVMGGRVYLGGLGDKGRGDCYALNAQTGELIWRTSTGADNYDSSPARVGTLIAIGSVSGRVTWMDPADGAIVASYSPRPGYSFSTPAGNERITCAAGMNGRLAAITTPVRATREE